MFCIKDVKRGVKIHDPEFLLEVSNDDIDLSVVSVRRPGSEKNCSTLASRNLDRSLVTALTWVEEDPRERVKKQMLEGFKRQHWKRGKRMKCQV